MELIFDFSQSYSKGALLNTHDWRVGLMTFNTIIRTSEHSPRNDESAVGAINRPLHCHAERSEGSVVLGCEMLRCAQHDRALTHTDAWIIFWKCITGPYWWWDYLLICINVLLTELSHPEVRSQYEARQTEHGHEDLLRQREKKVRTLDLGNSNVLYLYSW